MSKLFALASCIFTVSALQAQTCVGLFNLRLFDQESKKPITDKLEKSIVYAFTLDENEFYDDVQTVVAVDSVMRSPQGYTVYDNEKGYNFLNNSDPSQITVATRCGLYLIHMDFYRKNDTMRLSLYNIPAHQSFQIDTVMFRKGDYYIDLQASTRLHDFKFQDDKGYFLIPPDEITAFPEKDEKE